ncbi:endonuclease [Tenacibaculum maritimum]|uniref:endonuclease n=1 Tax=Tenacibaculum maritimum TaxID=107401 RepID=UPI0012E6A65C|nr:endonuclease [Tenacibaculum maritimum]CAA0194729.1 Putative endonuclease precursor containing a C-terminal secretion signal [Tenacibaculum maritimum]
MVKKLLTALLIVASVSITVAQQAYYSDVDLTLTGAALKEALALKIKSTHTNLLSYTPGVWEASKITDANPDNPSEVLLIYGWEDGSDSEVDNDRVRSGNLQDSGNGDLLVWNREHVYSKSLATPKLETGSPGAGTDAHNLRPADKTRNSTRNNYRFGDGSGNSGFSSVTYVGPNGPNTNAWYPGDEWKGDIARMVMYMYLRYETQCLPSGVGVGSSEFTDDEMIDLFLKWNAEDPVSDIEKARNTYHGNTANTYAQGNRNPFIDNPYLATRIWGGDTAQDLWGIYTGSDTEAPTVPANVVVSNETTSSIDVSWDPSTDNVGVTGYEVFLDGNLIKTTPNTTMSITDLTPNTTYGVTIVAKDLINNKSAASNVVNGKTLEDTEAPTVPIGIVVSNQTDSSFKITWTPSTDNTAVTGYEVYVDGNLKTTTTNTTYTVTGLTISTTYSVNLLAKDGANNKSAQSATVNATTTDGASNGADELFFSEYVEPDGGNNKALEIANITSRTIDLAGYTVKRQSNGSGDWKDELDLSSGTTTSIVPGEVFVIINGGASNQKLIDEADLVVSSNFGAPVNFNGNDAVGLFKNGVLIDIIGVFNSSDNYAKDITLRRKSNIAAPNTTFDLQGEWDTFAGNTFDGIGTHSSTLSTKEFDKSIFNVYPIPAQNSLFVKTSSNITIDKFSIYTIRGKNVLNVYNPSNRINVSHLNQGIYILKIRSGNKFSIKKFIKR